MAVQDAEGMKTLFVVKDGPQKEHVELQDFIGITELEYRRGALNKRWKLEETHPLWTDERRSNEVSDKYPSKDPMSMRFFALTGKEGDSSKLKHLQTYQVFNLFIVRGRFAENKMLTNYHISIRASVQTMRQSKSLRNELCSKYVQHKTKSTACMQDLPRDLPCDLPCDLP